MSAAAVSVVTPPDMIVRPLSACSVARASMLVAALRFTFRRAATEAVMSMSAAVETNETSRPAVTLAEVLRLPTLVTRMSVPAVSVSVAVNAPPTLAVMFPSVAVTGSLSVVLVPETRAMSEPAVRERVALIVVPAVMLRSSPASTVAVSEVDVAEFSVTSSAASTAALMAISEPVEVTVTASPAVSVSETTTAPPPVSVMSVPASRACVEVIEVAAVRTMLPAVTVTSAFVVILPAVETNVTSLPASTVPEELRLPTAVTAMSSPAVSVSVEVNVPPAVAVTSPAVAVTGSLSDVLPPDVSVTSVPAVIDFVAVNVVLASSDTLPLVAATGAFVVMLPKVEVSVTSLAAVRLPETRIAPVAAYVTSLPLTKVVCCVIVPLLVTETLPVVVTGPSNVTLVVADWIVSESTVIAT